MTALLPGSHPARSRSAFLDAIDALADARPWLVPLALVLTAAPLLWPTVPPLIDLPNHMSRYRIGLEYATSPYFRQWFVFRWALVGNLGVDLIVQALGQCMTVEHATKLAVLMVALVTVAGMLLVANETHRRIPPTTAFAVPFVFGFPFNYGFVNFCLSIGLGLLALGLWMRWGRLGRTRLRAAMFAPIMMIVWLAHACGWGMLGLMIGAVELVARRDAGATWHRALGGTIGACLPLIASALPMLYWYAGGGVSGQPTIWNWDLQRKLVLLMVALKNDDPVIDLGSMVIVWIAFCTAILRNSIAFDRRIVAAGTAVLAAFIAMPDGMFGSGYADMRLTPYILALFAIAIRPIGNDRAAKLMSVVAVLFLIGHNIYQTASYIRLDQVWETQLEALDHLPAGSRVFGVVSADGVADWHGNRFDHLQRMAIVRRAAYTNGTWPPAASHTLFVRPELLAGYQDQDSQKLILPEWGLTAQDMVPAALARMPRARFDYFWLIGVEPDRWPHDGWLERVWSGPTTVLFKIRHDVS